MSDFDGDEVGTEGNVPAGEDPHGQSAAVAGLTATEMLRALDAGELTSVEAAEQLVGRIEALDTSGTRLASVLEVAPDAFEQAALLDAERQAGKLRGPLHGVPVLVKDNIDTVAPLHTTAGTTAFGDTSPGLDATLVKALRQAGALVLGKANLSEFANFRGRPSSSGWSAAGGQTRNPHVLDRTPGGSSAGSGAAVSARLAPLAIGTETDGSILCPAAACGVAGLKPTVGLVSRTGIVPISSSQDTAGPIARSAEDLALLLEVLAGAVDDGEDEAAVSSRRPAKMKTHFLSLLGDGSLGGLRVGILRSPGFSDYHPPTDRAFAAVVAALGEAGAEVVDPLEGPETPFHSGKDELVVLCHEFGLGLEAYLARRAAQGGGDDFPRTMEEMAAHLRSDPAERHDIFGIELVERAAESLKSGQAAYEAARANNDKARANLDQLFSGDNAVHAVAVPAMAPAWLIDHVVGDQTLGAGWSASAVAGYPSATLPYGKIGGLPVGTAILGPAWSEATLLRVLFGLERVLGPELTRPMPAFAETVSLRALS